MNLPSNVRNRLVLENCEHSFSIKDCILIKATVSDHRTYNNEPETYLNRVKILKNVGSK